MSILLHPAAAANFDAKAAALVLRVHEFPAKDRDAHAFPSEIIVAGSIEEKDIIGELLVSRSDYRGKKTANFFWFENKRFGLADQDYQQLHQLASSITSVKDIGRQVSDDFVETILFDWIRRRFKNESVDASFSTFS